MSLLYRLLAPEQPVGGSRGIENTQGARAHCRVLGLGTVQRAVHHPATTIRSVADATDASARGARVEGRHSWAAGGATRVPPPRPAARCVARAAESIRRPFARRVASGRCFARVEARAPPPSAHIACDQTGTHGTVTHAPPLPRHPPPRRRRQRRSSTPSPACSALLDSRRTQGAAAERSAKKAVQQAPARSIAWRTPATFAPMRRSAAT